MPYDHQVSQLLDIGASHTSAEEWPDYLALGLGAEHVPALVDMATDRVLLDDAKPPASWAPIHALRALAQLRAESAVGALVPLFDAYDPEDVGANELATVLGILGPAALPFVAAYLGRREADVYRRGLAAETVAGIGRSHPAARAACVAALAGALELFAVQPPELNAFLVAALLDLDATEALDVMERAFAGDAVEIDITGDWEDVQIELGTIGARTTPRPHYGSLVAAAAGMDRARRGPTGADAHGRRSHEADRKRAAKQKRKQAAASRRRNRRR